MNVNQPSKEILKEATKCVFTTRPQDMHLLSIRDRVMVSLDKWYRKGVEDSIKKTIRVDVLKAKCDWEDSEDIPYGVKAYIIKEIGSLLK